MQQLRPAQIRLTVRPPRRVVFVPRSPKVPWQTAFTAALGRAAARWGGIGDLVIPFGDDLAAHPLFWALVELQDPDAFEGDVLTGVDLADFDPSTRAQQERLARERLDRAGFGPDHDRQWVDDLVLGTIELPEDVADLLLSRIAPAHDPGPSAAQHLLAHHSADNAVVDLADLPETLRIPESSVGPDGTLLLAAELGVVGRQQRVVLSERGVQAESLNVDSPLALAAAALSGPSGTWPWTLSQHGLGWYQRPHQRRPSATLVVGDDAWDFALAYALRRLTGLSFWVPSSIQDDPVLLDRQFERARRLADRAGRVVQVTSFSDPDAAARLAGSVGGPARRRPRAGVELVGWHETLPDQGNRLSVLGQYGLPVSLLVEDGWTTPLPTPLPDVRCVEEWRTEWMVEASLDDVAFLRHGGLAGRMLAAPGMSAFSNRVTASGVAYYATSTLTVPGPLSGLLMYPRVRVVPVFEQIEHALNGTGWTVSQSDKGAYAHRAAELFGSFKGLVEALRDPPIQRLLYAYLSSKAQPDAPGRWLSADSRRVLHLDDVVALLAEPDESDAETTLGQVDRLREVGALTMGATLKCVRCRQQSWYDVEQFGRSFRCVRCRLDQPSERRAWGGVEPRWSYQLDEALLQFVVHNGDLPVLAAADHLPRRRIPVPVEAAFEMEFKSPDGESFEQDIVLLDGCDLVLGEATVKDNFGDKQTAARRLRQLKATSALLAARRILLATSQPKLTDDTVNAAKRAFPGPWPTVDFEAGCAVLQRPTRRVSDGH